MQRDELSSEKQSSEKLNSEKSGCDKISSEKLDAEKFLAEGRTIQFKPIGYSMYPLFVPGRDEAIVAPARDAALRRGEVALYRRDGGNLVLHRICRHDGKGFYMVGDNESKLEGPLRKEQIKGILVGMIRKGKYFSSGNVIYRVAAGLWLWMRPVRPYLAGLASKIKRIVKWFADLFNSRREA